MSFELLPTVTYWVAGILAVAGVGVLLLAVATATVVAGHRRTRLARHQSLRIYYRGLVPTH